MAGVLKILSSSAKCLALSRQSQPCAKNKKNEVRKAVFQNVKICLSCFPTKKPMEKYIMKIIFCIRNDSLGKL